SAALKRARLTDHHGRYAELPYETAAVPAWFERGDHDGVTVGALPASVPEGVRLAVHARVVVLYASVMTAPEQRTVVPEERRPDGDAAFGETRAGLLESDLEERAMVQRCGQHSSSL